METAVVKLSVIQMTSQPDVEANLSTIEQQLVCLTSDQEPLNHQEHLVVLPECCLFFGGADSAQLSLAKETSSSQYLVKSLAALAKKYHAYLVAGSIPLLAENGQKFTNSSLLINPSGEIVVRYDKIHLFDVSVADNEGRYLESKYTQAGDKLALAKLPFAYLGLTVCYDLRFPELFRSLTVAGADIITVPAAFTKVTGQAHWQTLLQARAIENQVYIVAAGQEGQHQNGRETWGHSMIISPWGEILAELPQGQGSASTVFNQTELNKVRASIPVASHNKFTTELTL